MGDEYSMRNTFKIVIGKPVWGSEAWTAVTMLKMSVCGCGLK